METQQIQNTKNTPTNKFSLIISCLAILLSAAAILLHFMGNKAVIATSEGQAQPAAQGEITYAFIETDSIFEQYDMVIDVMGEIANTEKKLQADLQKRAKKFQNDYENYLKVGATMTLSEQKKREGQLEQEQKNLVELEQKYTEQLYTLRNQRNLEVQDKIFSFISDYNKTHGNYSLVMSKSRTSGVLYSPEYMDITHEVLTALNNEYASAKTK